MKTYGPDQKQVLTPIQAGRVTYSLQQVVDGGTGKAAAFGKPAAGKTGTTQNNADAWFVGYTPKLTAAVWMGYPDSLKSMDDVHGIKVQGGTFPAEMWRKFMQSATADFDTGTFPEYPAEELGAGNVLDPNMGTSGVIVSGESSIGATATTQPHVQTTQPQTQTTAPATSTPTTVPPTTPTTTSPPATPTTTAPATGQGTGTGKGKGPANSGN